MLKVWGEVNFWAAVFGGVALIPDFGGSLMQPTWLAFAILGAAGISEISRLGVSVLLNRFQQ